MRLGKREDLDGDKAVDLSLTMASASLNDRYTLYTDREGVLKLASQLRGRFPGVGIQIRRDAVRDGLLVATPIKGSPAYKAGIQAGDLITEIRLEVDKFGKPLAADAQKVFSTKGMKTEDAVNIILGAPNSPVTLVVQREGREGAEGVQAQPQLRDGRDRPRRAAEGQRRLAVLPRRQVQDRLHPPHAVHRHRPGRGRQGGLRHRTPT